MTAQKTAARETTVHGVVKKAVTTIFIPKRITKRSTNPTVIDKISTNLNRVRCDSNFFKV